MEINHALLALRASDYGVNTLSNEIRSIKHSILDAAYSTQNITRSLTNLCKATTKLNHHLDRLERLSKSTQNNIRRIREI